jgi:hypothetical protein
MGIRACLRTAIFLKKKRSQGKSGVVRSEYERCNAILAIKAI